MGKNKTHWALKAGMVMAFSGIALLSVLFYTIFWIIESHSLVTQ